MRKIQVSTVKQTADVEVIFMNVTFVAKVLKAAYALRTAKLDLDFIVEHSCSEEEARISKELEKVDDLFTELEIAFGIKEELKPVESKEDPFNANVSVDE